MRRTVLVLAFVALPALAGCKGMGGFASGLGHVASGLGHVASAAGHVASAVGRVAAPVASGVARVAVPVVGAAAKAAPTVGRAAVYAAEAVAEASVAGPVEVETDEPVFDDQREDPGQDLCLDCPDSGNCASCPADRQQ